MLRRNRRHLDRTGDERPMDKENELIENRIYVAAPGQKLRFRRGTENLIGDDIYEATWGTILRILEKGGVLKLRSGKLNEWIKKIEGLGEDEEQFEKSTKDWLSEAYEQELRQLNPKNKQERRELINKALKVARNISEASFDMMLTPEIMADIGENLMAKLKHEVKEGEWEEEKLSDIILEFLNEHLAPILESGESEFSLEEGEVGVVMSYFLESLMNALCWVHQPETNAGGVQADDTVGAWGVLAPPGGVAEA